MSIKPSTIAAVLTEIGNAQRKHGVNFIGSLTADLPQHADMLEDLVATGRQAKFDMEEMGDVCRSNVLAEEVGEFAEALLAEDKEHARKELVQVAAMALAWLEAVS